MADEVRAMKKTAHTLNIIVLALIAAVGIAMIPQAIALTRTVTEPSGYGETIIVWVYLALLLILDLVFFISGVLFPEELTYPDEKQSWFLSFITLLNMVVNRRVMGSAAVEGKTPYIRSWEPAGGLLWLILLAVPGAFTYHVGNRTIQVLCLISLALIAAHTIISFFWKMARSKEQYGTYNFKGILIPMVCILVLFAVASAATIAHTSAEEQNDYLNVQDLQERIEEAKGRAAESGAAAQPGQKLDMTGVVEAIKADMDTTDKIYYKLKESDEGENHFLTFAVWTDSRDDVFWYRFLAEGDGYYFDSGMKSDTVNKAELVGTEDGTL